MASLFDRFLGIVAGVSKALVDEQERRRDAFKQERHGKTALIRLRDREISDELFTAFLETTEQIGDQKHFLHLVDKEIARQMRVRRLRKLGLPEADIQKKMAQSKLRR